MAGWRLPPKAKVYEAFSAVADGRVSIAGPGTAEVVSSARDRTYTVEWSGDGAVVSSNDNASYWQGYLGYPIIAVLLVQGRVRADEGVVGLLGGVPWHDLNARFKRDYDAAVEHVLESFAEREPDRAHVVAEVDGVMAQLEALDLQRAGRGRRPPRGA
jgi:hypothetical protein